MCFQTTMNGVYLLKYEGVLAFAMYIVKELCLLLKGTGLSFYQISPLVST